MTRDIGERASSSKGMRSWPDPSMADGRAMEGVGGMYWRSYWSEMCWSCC